MLLRKFAYATVYAGLLLIPLACTSSQEASVSATPIEVDLEALQKILADQVAAWNAGDIDAFMTGYWNSDSLRFVSGNTERKGWQSTIERYRTTYPDRAAMGHLTFEELAFRRLSPNWATGFGRFRLKREESLGDLTGLFTLLFEKRNGRWMIVQDHTST